jgi:transposase InsO family protein
MEENEYQEIIKAVNQQRQPKARIKYLVRENVLYKDARPNPTRVLKKGETEAILELYHNNPLSGHFGKAKTLDRIKKQYYWPNMYSDITKYVESCFLCQATGRQRRNNPITPMPIQGLWERVSIDFIGPLNITKNNNRYIITAMDNFSHWPEAKAVPEATAEVAARFIYEDIICRHGAINVIQTDQGTYFVNQLMIELFKKFDIKHHKITAYHPQANGQIERFNGTFKKTLTKISKETNDWDEFIAPALFAYRTSKIEAI